MSALPVADGPSHIWYAILSCGCAVGAVEDHPSSLDGTPGAESLAAHEVLCWLRVPSERGWPYASATHPHPATAGNCGRTEPVLTDGVEVWTADGSRLSAGALFIPHSLSFGDG